MGLGRLRALLRRLTICVTAAAAVVALGYVGTTLSTAPEAANVLFEPLSLLLLPGLLASLSVTTVLARLQSGGYHGAIHDVIGGYVLFASFLFYLVVGFVWLGRRRARRASGLTRAGASR